MSGSPEIPGMPLPSSYGKKSKRQLRRKGGREKRKKRDLDTSSESSEDTWNASSQHSRSPSPDLVQNDKGLRYSLAIYRKPELGSERIIRDRVHKSYEPFEVPVRMDLPPRAKKQDELEPQINTSRPPYVLEIVQNAYDSGYTCEESRRVNPALQDLHITQTLPAQLRLVSNNLRGALKSIIDYYPEHKLNDFEDTIMIAYPYPMLMHHFDEIESMASLDAENLPNNKVDTKTDEERREMKILRDVLLDTFNSLVVPCRKLLSSSDPTANFDMLWYVFRPGDDVYVETPEGIAGAVVREINNRSHISEVTLKRSSWTISYWYLMSIGSTVGRVTGRTTVARYHGERLLRSLSICPAAIWDRHDGGKRRAEIMLRNKSHLDALKKGSLHAMYDGPKFSNTRVSLHKPPQTNYCGKIVIDHSNGYISAGSVDMFDMHDTYQRFWEYDGIHLKDNVPDQVLSQPLRPPLLPSESETLRSRQEEYHSKASEITDHQLWLLHPRVPAFALATKAWFIISMDYVSPIESSEESIDNLVIDQNTIRIIRALSTRQDKSNESWNADYIEGKGAGQIILLHGPPGVGKTHTVESISAWLGRPLLALTVADLGTKETEIEQELTKWFDYAEAWNAVVLVDEADVFLEQRKTRDLSRNGLVTAFLRQMEYFRGLLFLTTNRVGQIDDAFMSRVHLAIGYENLTPETRKQIWKGFFNKLARERSGKIMVGRQAKQYVLESEEVQRVELNGREIRNALQTAITLAEFETLEQDDRTEGEPIVVEESHFRRVLEMTEKFKKYIASIRMEDEAKRAYSRGDRQDYPQ